MKHFFKGIIKLKGDLYETITNTEEIFNNKDNHILQITNSNQEILFDNGFKLKFNISGFKSHRKNNIYVPMNIIYKFELLNSLKQIVTEKEFKINEVSRLLNSFSIIYDGIIYIVKVETLASENKDTHKFNEESLKAFVLNTNITNDEIVNMCYIVLKNINIVKSNNFSKMIIDKVEKSNIYINNHEDLKTTMASLLANLVKNELTTNSHTENINDIIDFYHQRYFNSVA